MGLNPAYRQTGTVYKIISIYEIVHVAGN